VLKTSVASTFFLYAARPCRIGEWLADINDSDRVSLHRRRWKFEATGTVFQHAGPEGRGSPGSESESSVAQIVKSLNELCTTAMRRVYKDERRGLFQTLEAGQFGPQAQASQRIPEGRYVLNGALVKYLAPAAQAGTQAAESMS